MGVIHNVHGIYQATKLCLEHGLDIKNVIVFRPSPGRNWITHNPIRGEIFSYDFMNHEGRNVATYIDYLGLDTLQIQPGLDGKGRVWGLPITHELTIEELPFLADLQKELT